jgi:hypothetical protein
VPILTEGKLACAFPDTWHAMKYDDWAFYRNQFQNCCGGNKGIDFLAYDPAGRTLWLVEMKDYRQFRRTKTDAPWDEVGLKARDTLAGIFAAKVNAADTEEVVFARRALGATHLRVVLHLEQPRNNSRLFPRAYDPADVLQKLKQTLKPIDAHPRVIELRNMCGVPWQAASRH